METFHNAEDKPSTQEMAHSMALAMTVIAKEFIQLFQMNLKLRLDTRGFLDLVQSEYEDIQDFFDSLDDLDDSGASFDDETSSEAEPTPETNSFEEAEMMDNDDSSKSGGLLQSHDLHGNVEYLELKKCILLLHGQFLEDIEPELRELQEEIREFGIQALPMILEHLADSHRLSQIRKASMKEMQTTNMARELQEILERQVNTSGRLYQMYLDYLSREQLLREVKQDNEWFIQCILQISEMTPA